MKIELLAPAGSPEALDAAIGEGADAVYLGLKDFNARLRSANFTYSQFEGALRSLRKMKKKVYVTVNTVFEQREADRMYQFLKYLEQQGPDAIIVQDFGVIEMVKREFPFLRLHASTQMNIASARGANALSRHGVSRVVLARELSLEELKDIKSETNLELEVFVHGALCISVSGLCLFSSFLGGKSANRGMCTQACRRLYHYADRSDGKSGYYFSPNDLQLLDRIPDLAAAGIAALKIEGRMKSASYVGAVVSAYRLVADAVINGGDDEVIRRSIEQGQEILRNDFARAKTQYFFAKKIDAQTQRYGEEKRDNIDWLNPEQDGGTGISLGTIQKVKGSGNERRAFITPPKELRLSAHDSVRIHKNDDSARFTQKLIFTEKTTGSGCWISVTEGSTGDHVYLIQTKEMRKRYAPVIANNANSKGPGREKAPFPLSANKEKTGKKSEAFPEGFYAAVSRPEDLFIIQSSRPERVMLSMSQKNIKALLADNRKPLPFKPADIILTLDPWFAQEAAGYETGGISADIEQLVEKGYTQFIVNNPGHFSLFKGYEKIKLIAGPWLYMFNSWSLSFITSFGVDGFVCPLENNRQNLERTLGLKSRNSENKTGRKKGGTVSHQSKFFITVFSWPPLFNIRANLASVLDFKTFTDNRDENFSLVTGFDGSRVYPQKYFSIIDKIPFLKEAGFGRFIIDLSGSAVKKADYRDLMNAIKENAPLPNSGRFNWKDGFYRLEPKPYSEPCAD
ncbi:MAG: U32 family peptidase [Treponema sp.]|nr:U32 family peptidase [Treponema sp.]MCL2273221.1 U32 family peptidase [Treponema sp.]